MTERTEQPYEDLPAPEFLAKAREIGLDDQAAVMLWRRRAEARVMPVQEIPNVVRQHERHFGRGCCS